VHPGRDGFGVCDGSFKHEALEGPVAMQIAHNRVPAARLLLGQSGGAQLNEANKRT
jgi:hypothetical protein